MTGKTYKSIYYHIVIITKGRQKFLKGNIKEKVNHFIWNKSKKLGLYLHRIGGIEDHLHMLIYIPPKMAVAKAVGQLKGSSSYFVNQECLGNDMLYWQQGYGVITISKESFQKVYDYVKNQEEHHKNNDIWNDYEEINSED